MICGGAAATDEDSDPLDVILIPGTSATVLSLLCGIESRCCLTRSVSGRATRRSVRSVAFPARTWQGVLRPFPLVVLDTRLGSRVPEAPLW
jgi:hypothetical protein